MTRLEYLRSLVIIILSATLLCGCADWGLKRAIKAYRGDGRIQYLEAPMLGASGCAIQMPTLDLSQPVHVQYDFTGIPAGVGKYWIYLVVSEPCPMQTVLQGEFHLHVKKNNDKVRNLKSVVNNMINERGGNENRFYFESSSDSDQETSGISVEDSTSKWFMAVSYTNAVLKEPVEAYILITRGGCK